MGCDIHLQVERRVNGVWERVPHPLRPCDDEYCTDGKYNEKTPNPDRHGEDHFHCGGTGSYMTDFYHDRNYDVFGILADVRNGRGFAGSDTGDGFIPISLPKGLPPDLSDEIRGVVEDTHWWCDNCEAYRSEKTSVTLTHDGHSWEEDACPVCEQPFVKYDWHHSQHFWLGDHSFSYLTVDEILNYGWDQVTKHRGWVDPGQFEIFRKEGKPYSWSGGVSGNGVKHVSNVAMSRMIDDGEILFEGEYDEDAARGFFYHRPYSTPLSRGMKEMGVGADDGTVGAQIMMNSDQYYTQIEWDVTYRETAAGFLKILERDIQPLGDPKDVRVVFGFDS